MNYTKITDQGRLFIYDVERVEVNYTQDDNNIELRNKVLRVCINKNEGKVDEVLCKATNLLSATILSKLLSVDSFTKVHITDKHSKSTRIENCWNPITIEARVANLIKYYRNIALSLNWDPKLVYTRCADEEFEISQSRNKLRNVI